MASINISKYKSLFEKNFFAIKRAFGGSPSALREIADFKGPEFQAVCEVYEAYQWLDRHHRDQKIIHSTDRNFIDLWSDFNRNWLLSIKFIQRHELTQRLREILGDEKPELFARPEMTFERFAELMSDGTWAARSGDEWEPFDPDRSDPNDLMAGLYALIDDEMRRCDPHVTQELELEFDMLDFEAAYEEKYPEQLGTFFSDLQHSDYVIRLRERVASRGPEDRFYDCQNFRDFLNYTKDVIGLDVSRALQKWRDVPHFFVPENVEIGSSDADKGTLYELLNDAIRAYVAGAPAAAAAMCRAALEMTLVDHFDIDCFQRDADGIPKKNKRGDTYTLPLEKIIHRIERDRRFEWVKRFDLLTLKQMADDVMHRYSRRNRLSAEEDEKIVEFIRAIGALIEGAPGKPR